MTKFLTLIEGSMAYMLLIIAAITAIYPLVWDIVKRNPLRVTKPGWIFISLAVIGIILGADKIHLDDKAQLKKDTLVQNLNNNISLQQNKIDSLTRLYNRLHDQADDNTKILLAKASQASNKPNIINQYGIMPRKISESQLMSLIRESFKGQPIDKQVWIVMIVQGILNETEELHSVKNQILKILYGNGFYRINEQIQFFKTGNILADKLFCQYSVNSKSLTINIPPYPPDQSH